MANRWRTKSVEQSIADTDEPDTRLRKELTWRDLVVFGVAVVIGAGIFTVTASTAGDITGPAIWISFASDRRNYLALSGLALFVFVQCPWTWNGLRYERKNAYSGSRAMAHLLRTEFRDRAKVFGIGFSTVGVQPYFPSNIYDNYAGRSSFWAWQR